MSTFLCGRWSQAPETIGREGADERDHEPAESVVGVEKPSVGDKPAEAAQGSQYRQGDDEVMDHSRFHGVVSFSLGQLQRSPPKPFPRCRSCGPFFMQTTRKKGPFSWANEKETTP